MGKIAVYPGSFDPITFGHIDIVGRALECFDGVIVAIATDSQKNTLFTVEERVEMARLGLREKPDVVVESFQGLLVDYVARTKATVITGTIRRGLSLMSSASFSFSAT